MTYKQKRSYSLKINRASGTVESLSVPSDPHALNLVHTNVLTGFGALAWTPRGKRSAWLAPSGPPLHVESVHLDEQRSFAPVESVENDRIICRNRILGHTLSYELSDEHFDIWLKGDLPDADQVGIDLDCNFMDLRQSDPPEHQFTVQCPYRSENRSIAYVFLARPTPPGMLITCLTPAAGWRLRYGRNQGAPAQFRQPLHAVLGMQMLARFHSSLDSKSEMGPVNFGLRVSFPANIAEARKYIAHELRIPIVTAPSLGSTAGDSLPFQVMGPAIGASLERFGSTSTMVSLKKFDNDLFGGIVRLDTEGFYLLKVWNSEGRGSDLVLHAGAPWLETLKRSLHTLDPLPPSNAESSYWIQAMALGRSLLGADQRQDRLMLDALVGVHMQGAANYSSLAEVEKPSKILSEMPSREGRYVGAPWPTAHEFRNKRFSPFHLFEHDRVQDAFSLVQTFLFAARAFNENGFYEHAVRIADAHIEDNIDQFGKVYCIAKNGIDIHDYTTVISPLQALADLAVEMEIRKDPRVERIRATCIKVADFLVQRGLEFPTEGVPPHIRWTEDGSIACTALSLLYAWCHIEPRNEWLQMAGRALAFHESWGMDVPDVRMNGSSYRYWETQWENDGEGRAINSGHPWSLWRAEALFYWALATGDALRLLQSWNGYISNRCKFSPEGVTYACFTPDYLPDRPRTFSLMHAYPQKPDRSISFYLWPRIAQTWLRTSAILDASQTGFNPQVGPIVANATLVQTGNGSYTLHSHATHFDRLFLQCECIHKLCIETSKPVQVVPRSGCWEVCKGKESGMHAIEPINGTIVLQRNIVS